MADAPPDAMEMPSSDQLVILANSEPEVHATRTPIVKRDVSNLLNSAQLKCGFPSRGMTGTVWFHANQTF